MRSLATCMLLLFLVSAHAQKLELDSIYQYGIEEGKEFVDGKSYWKYDPVKHQSTSAYYLWDADHNNYRHINDQYIRYRPGSRDYAVFVTHNHLLNRFDSTIYYYNADEIYVKKENYNKKPEGSYELNKIEEYHDLDHTDRKRNHTKTTFSKGEIHNVFVDTFLYTYNGLGQLIERIDADVEHGKIRPRFKLVQAYDESGRIQQVGRYKYQPATKGFDHFEQHEYQYEENKRIHIQHQKWKGQEDFTPYRTIVKIYLPGEERVLQQLFYEGAEVVGTPYRRDVYFYSEQRK